MADSTGKTIFGISKSSVIGTLSLLATTLGTLTGLQAPVFFNTNASHVWLYITGGATIGLALCRAWLGWAQGDANKNPTS